MSRVAYFKNVDQASVDADQASAILSLQGSITSINSTLSTKANSSDVNTALALKADSSALSSYALVEDIPDVSGFALSSDVTTALASKADSSDLAGLASSSSVTALSGRVDALETKDGQINNFVNALAEVLYVSNADNSSEYDYSAFM
jgi:hypothetical protein